MLMKTPSFICPLDEQANMDGDRKQQSKISKVDSSGLMPWRDAKGFWFALFHSDVFY